MLFACIYVPEFPAQAIARTTPELREQAMAVLDGTPPILTVIAANSRAREFGINIGMTKLQAEACPHVHLRRRSLLEEDAANAALLDANAQYKELARRYEEIDADREARLQALLKMDALFKDLQKRCDSESRDNIAADLERK